MDDDPREESDDDLWWVPWHWGPRQWCGVFLILVVAWFGPAIWLLSHLLG